MRVFRHGDSLAIVIPPSIRAAFPISDNDEFEFVALEDGVLVLVSRDKISKMASEKVLGLLLKRAMDSPSSPAPVERPAASSVSPSSQQFSNQPPSFSQPAPTFVTASEFSKRQPAVRSQSIESLLGGKGFAVLDEATAKSVSKSLESDIQAGQVFGFRGFDNKFYIITRAEFEPLCEKMVGRLSRGAEMSPEQAAAALKEDATKVACAFHVLTERGDALEKRKGIFVLLD